MQRVRSAPATLALVALVALACGKASPPAPAALGEASVSAAPSTKPGPRKLPEDPVKAARATEQWRRHLAEEERERRLMYDKAREEEHESILAVFTKARARYDTAKTKAQVTAAAASFTAARPALWKKIEAIDPKRLSSNLLPDYESLLTTLQGPYPEARIASLAGDASAEQTLRVDIEQRLAKARAWLDEEGEEERERERAEQR